MVLECAQLATQLCTFNQTNANNAHTIAAFAPTQHTAITTAQRTITGTVQQDNVYQMELKESFWLDYQSLLLFFISFSD